ncbi:hypothetical protein HPB51_007218 [Rhipicephalus microplus]|uniref:Tetratricopeptide repeat protein n=1 Tax=Rhipicephalus microplus TaxID=6941 RepID=A0A9J6E036_RHIMP|nr:hypothetical protein HPB51_007218 [Rhipicephalus microplus]
MPTAELYNNLALCCFYAQQYDMALACFDRALALAEDQHLADVWYNLGLVALLGMPTAELYNNLALCCFYAQQYDMALTCFDRALALAEDQHLADVWYNLGLVALSSGDKTLATRAFRLALVYDNCHAESYNNLGVLELTSGNVDQTGDLQGCARAASKCSQHAASADLLQKVQAFFQSH